jgi:hypothetical protein
MPTGYTAELCDGEVDFATFVLTCALAMGATIHQRDDSIGVLPKHREPSDYHAKAIQRARDDLAMFEVYTDAEVDRLAQMEYGAALAQHRESVAKAASITARLTNMLGEVEAWTPPTADHEGLKTFMVDQLQQTLEFDGRSYSSEPDPISGAQFREEKITKAKRDIKYHTEHHAEELRRCAEANEWIDALAASVGEPTT